MCHLNGHIDASMRELDIERQATTRKHRRVNTNWISRLARLWGRLLSPVEGLPAEFVDRDAERIRRELDLIKLRFPHHA
jgi:hypothetical protein